MKKTPLEKGLYFLSRRRFAECLLAIEPAIDMYRESFAYYLTGGLACLYLDDFGSANSYFQHARQFSTRDTTLLLAQAALFIRHGDTERAVQYYLDVLEQEPRNRIAKKGLAFIKEKGHTPEEIYRLLDSKKLKMFYPSLGFNPDFLTLGFVITSIIALAFGVFMFLNRPRDVRFWNSGNGLEAKNFYLSNEELNEIGSADYSKMPFLYHYTDSELEKFYRNAYKYATTPVDNESSVRMSNMAIFEINKILNSNASDVVKQKSRDILNAIKSDKEHEPKFSTLLDKEKFSCEEVMDDPLLYSDCWIVWSGLIFSDDGTSFDFYVYDDKLEHPQGKFEIIFNGKVPKNLVGDRFVQILAKVHSVISEDGKINVTLLEKEHIPMMRNQAAIQQINQK